MGCIYTAIKGVRNLRARLSWIAPANFKKLYQAVVDKRPVFNDRKWGKATLEVLLAILQSSKESREIFLDTR